MTYNTICTINSCTESIVIYLNMAYHTTVINKGIALILPISFQNLPISIYCRFWYYILIINPCPNNKATDTAIAQPITPYFFANMICAANATIAITTNINALNLI